MKTSEITKDTPSIRCGWPENVKFAPRKKNGKNLSRSKLSGSRELGAPPTMIVKRKRLSNAVAKLRKKIAETKLARARFSVFVENPDFKVPALKDGERVIQLRTAKGGFARKIKF